MCKHTKSSNKRIDPCMRYAIKHAYFSVPTKILACCCGHFVYPMTIIVKQDNQIRELLSGANIPRKVRFYKKDKNGLYYVPEVSKEYKDR